MCKHKHLSTHFTDKRMSISESYFALCSFTDMTNKSFAVEFTITDEFQIRTCTCSLRFTDKVNVTFFIKAIPQPSLWSLVEPPCLEYSSSDVQIFSLNRLHIANISHICITFLLFLFLIYKTIVVQL